MEGGRGGCRGGCTTAQTVDRRCFWAVVHSMAEDARGRRTTAHHAEQADGGSAVISWLSTTAWLSGRKRSGASTTTDRVGPSGAISSGSRLGTSGSGLPTRDSRLRTPDSGLRARGSRLLSASLKNMLRNLNDELRNELRTSFGRVSQRVTLSRFACILNTICCE